MSLQPKNWSAFQHYKDRSPAWIKLHRGLLDDFAFSRLPLASKALAPLLWLLASEYDEGKITSGLDEIAFRLRISIEDLRAGLKPLIDSGFFLDASGVLAECKQDAIPEREKEKQVKTEKEEDIRAVAKATRPDRNEAFEEFWKAYPKREGANPKSPARKLFEAAVKSGVDPPSIVAGARAYATDPATKVGTTFVAQAMTWLRQRRWEDAVARRVVNLELLEAHRRACMERNSDEFGSNAAPTAARTDAGAGHTAELRSAGDGLRNGNCAMEGQLAVPIPRPGSAWNGK